MKLTNSRYYLDFNATSPLAPSVKEWLAKGDLPFGNPSGPHTQAKLSLKKIEEVRSFLKKIFHRDSSDWTLFFHSGATEGINTLVKGIAESEFSNGKRINFLYSKTDHASVINQRDYLKLYGHTESALSFDLSDFEKSLALDKKNIINVTLLHNETGALFPKENLEKIKSREDLIILGDATQLVGKVENWEKIDPRIDAISFSGHKFGAFKNSGFTIFNNKRISLKPLHAGAGQESGLRGGSQDPVGIITIKLALEDVLKIDHHRVRRNRDHFETTLLNEFGKRIEIVHHNLPRSTNTTLLIIKDVKIDSVATAFDMAALDVGRGASCSSGLSTHNRILVALGYEKELTKNVFRISFPPSFSDHDFFESEKIFVETLRRFLIS